MTNRLTVMDSDSQNCKHEQTLGIKVGYDIPKLINTSIPGE